MMVPGDGATVPQAVERPVLLCAAGVDLLVPELGKQHPSARGDVAARVDALGMGLLAAHRPVDGAGWAATEGLVGSDIVGR